MSNHSDLSPSGAERWMNCPGSYEKSKDIPVTTSVYAAEGTFAHKLLEYLVLKKDIGGLILDSYYKDEMLDYLNPIKDLIHNAQDMGSVVMVETTHDIPQIRGYGTVDYIILHNTGVLEILDLKYGRTKVNAEDNKQLMLYAYAVYIKAKYIMRIDTVRLTIMQPRIENYCSWDVLPETIVEWVEGPVRESANLAFSGKGELKPGRWCWFCPAKNKCEELVLKSALRDFGME